MPEEFLVAAIRIFQDVALFFARLAVRTAGVVIIFVGGSLSVVSASDLYMVATGQVLPGEPIFIDVVAAPIGEAFGFFLVGLVIVVVGYWIYKLAVKVKSRRG